MRAVGILLGAGRGERLGAREPKALLEIGGRALVRWAVDSAASAPGVEGLVLVVPFGFEGRIERRLPPSAPVMRIVPGGASRQASVAAGLASVPEDVELVVCHDVARPFAAPDLFGRVLEALRDADGAVPGVPVRDTVKRVDDGLVAGTLARDGLVLVQTPQAFRRPALSDAHRRAREDGVSATDDAALLERVGYRVAVVPGDPGNIKVTRPEDLALAEALAGARG